MQKLKKIVEVMVRNKVIVLLVLPFILVSLMTLRSLYKLNTSTEVTDSSMHEFARFACLGAPFVLITDEGEKVVFWHHDPNDPVGLHLKIVSCTYDGRFAPDSDLNFIVGTADSTSLVSYEHPYVRRIDEAFSQLESLPHGLGFPVHLKDKIRYDADGKFLIFKKIMSDEEKHELMQLSKDSLYRDAVEELFRESQYVYYLVFSIHEEVPSNRWRIGLKRSKDLRKWDELNVLVNDTGGTNYRNWPTIVRVKDKGYYLLYTRHESTELWIKPLLKDEEERLLCKGRGMDESIYWPCVYEDDAYLYYYYTPKGSLYAQQKEGRQPLADGSVWLCRINTDDFSVKQAKVLELPGLLPHTETRVSICEADGKLLLFVYHQHRIDVYESPKEDLFNVKYREVLVQGEFLEFCPCCIKEAQSNGEGESIRIFCVAPFRRILHVAPFISFERKKFYVFSRDIAI